MTSGHPFRVRVACAVLVLLAVAPDWAAAEDVHDLFEKRCGECHQHAGILARETLAIRDGRLVGRETGNEIRPFLLRHKGGVGEAEAALIHDLFFRQVQAAGRFRESCAICHVRARDVVRERLLVLGDRLVGRYSGRDMREFLRTHGRLTPAEAAVVHDSLHAIALGR